MLTCLLVTTRVGEDKSRIRPRSVARGEEPRHYRFRELNSTVPSRSNSGSQNEDRREEQARFWSERRALKQEDVKAAKPFPIPFVPPILNPQSNHLGRMCSE